MSRNNIPKLNLDDKANLLLTNLNDKGSLELVNTVLEYSTITNAYGKILSIISLNSLYPIFEHSKRFFIDNGFFPDAEYFEIQFSNFKKSEYPYNEDLIKDLMTELKQIKAKFLSDEAFSNKDYKKVCELISNLSYENRAKKPEHTIDNIISTYDKNKDKVPGVLSGVKELDHLIKCFKYKTLNVIAAPPGHFKTTFALSIVYNALNCNLNVLYLTLEVSSEDIWFNMIARHSHQTGDDIPAGNLKMATLDEEQREVLPSVIEHFKENIKGKLSVISPENMPEFTISSLDRFFDDKAEELGGIDLVVVDHINLMKFNKINGIKDEKEVLNFYIRYLTNKAVSFQDNGFVLLILSQVNRESILAFKALSRRKRRNNECSNSDVSSRGASLASFAEANELERSASTAVILHADDLLRASNTLDIYLLKNRNGELREMPITASIEPQYFKVGSDLDLDDEPAPDYLQNYLGDSDSDFGFA